ncbi:Putative antitoxin [Candidatus Anstonella stagnisolia]|nr:Putative antitoxin [Candidatus Anstonella stagnisolia]
MVKVISISEAAYALMRRFKKKDMSFSDVIIANVGQAGGEKVESAQDLLEWIEKQPSKGKKTKLSTQVDSIVYGV